MTTLVPAGLQLQLAPRRRIWPGIIQVSRSRVKPFRVLLPYFIIESNNNYRYRIQYEFICEFMTYDLLSWLHIISDILLVCLIICYMYHCCSQIINSMGVGAASHTGSSCPRVQVHAVGVQVQVAVWHCDDAAHNRSLSHFSAPGPRPAGGGVYPWWWWVPCACGRHCVCVCVCVCVTVYKNIYPSPLCWIKHVYVYPH